MKVKIKVKVSPQPTSWTRTTADLLPTVGVTYSCGNFAFLLPFLCLVCIRLRNIDITVSRSLEKPAVHGLVHDRSFRFHRSSLDTYRAVYGCVPRNTFVLDVLKLKMKN